MNLFQYFRVSGKAYWVDEKRSSVWFSRPDGTIEEVPNDGSFKRTICLSWYPPDFAQQIIDSYIDTGLYQPPPMFREFIHDPSKPLFWL